MSYIAVTETKIGWNENSNNGKLGKYFITVYQPTCNMRCQTGVRGEVR